MKKLLALLVVLGLLLPTLVGCHGSRGLDPFVMPDEFDTTRDYEITFWAKNDTNKAQTKVYEKAIADFETLYPNIRVNMRLYTDYGKIYNDVITNIPTNTTPDVCITYPDHIATYMTGTNIVVPLDDVFADENYGLGGDELKFESPEFDEIVVKYIDECNFDGHYYAVPFMRSTEACYVNRTYVEKLGFELPDVLTWDFVWEVAEAAMATDDDGNYIVNGQKVLIPFIYKSTDNMMIQMLRQLDAGYSGDEGEILLFNDETKEIVKTVADHAATGAFSTFKISGYPANFLNAGQCIFAVDSTAGSTWMGPDAPLVDISEEKITNFDVEVRMIPQMNSENPQMISQGPSVCVFNKNDPQQTLAAWLFTQYLLTDDVQIAYSETEGYVPVTTQARETDEYQSYLDDEGTDAANYFVKLRAVKMLIEHTDDTFITSVFNGSASLRDAAGQIIENAAKAVRRNQTVDDDFIEKQYTDVTALYHLDQIQTSSNERQELGKLPNGAIALIATLGFVWIGIVLYILNEKRRKIRNKF